jgi:hypothetical protein
MTEIWTHYSGYMEACGKVRAQSLEDDLNTIDLLYGRERLGYGATPEEVKSEALRQLEIEYRSERNEAAEFFVEVAKAERGSR